jgi:hypothetical protein
MFKFSKSDKKVKTILTEEDLKQLREIERGAYLEKAKELVKKRGESNAIRDLEIKTQEKKKEWEM